MEISEPEISEPDFTRYSSVDEGSGKFMSDVVYDPEVCRNISLDIRFALFVIDKLANADHLLEEMEILK